MSLIKPLFFTLSLLAGVLVAMQPAVNAEIARRIGSPYAAAMISLFISFIILVPVLSLFGVRPSFAPLLSAPWWIFLGGLAGAFVVTGGIVAVPAIGAAAFVLCIVLGQMVGASLVDHFALFGVAQKPMTMMRIIGIGVMMLGLIIVLKSN
jgi:transporter family-2 protein